MNLVIEYFDGEYYITSCLKYESKENFLIDFEKFLKTIKNNIYFEFSNKQFYSGDFIECGEIILPKVFELNEWFDKKLKK